MIPRSFHRHIVLASTLLTIAVGPKVPFKNANAHAMQGYTKGFCASTLDEPVVYFSNIFDESVPHGAIDTTPLDFAFFNYLKEEFDYRTNANHPTNCGIFDTLSQAEAGKGELQAQVQKANKQIKDVTWKPGLGAEVLHSSDPNFMPKAPPHPTYTYCVVPYKDTMYFSSVFDTLGGRIDPAWNDAFNDFLRKNYSAEGEAQCTMMNTRREINRNLNARVASIRANNHKAVETGWRYNASVVVAKATPKPTPKVDDDPEPAPRPVASTTSNSARDFAQKEGAAALMQCQNDRIMSGAFDCRGVQRVVYNYRIAHAGEAQPEPLADLLNKLDCSECIVDYQVKMWAKSAAVSRGLQPSGADCVAQRFVANVHSEPYPAHARKVFEATMASCH